MSSWRDEKGRTDSIPAFQHPATGAEQVYEPSRFGGERFAVGERTALYYDPQKDSVGRPLDRPFRDGDHRDHRHRILCRSVLLSLKDVPADPVLQIDR